MVVTVAEDTVQLDQTKILIVAQQSEEQECIRSIFEERTDWKHLFLNPDKTLFQRITQEKPDVILADLQDIPSGLDFVERCHKKLPAVPLILLTSRDDVSAFQALRRGAHNYVPWQLVQEELTETIDNVLSAREVHRCRNRLIANVRNLDMSLVLGNDPSLIAPLKVLLEEYYLGVGICDEATCIRLAIAVEEAILNAMYHGNLEVSSELRNDPDRGDAPFREEIERRRQLDPYRGRKVFIRVVFNAEESKLIIRDEGPGFDPSKLPDPTDPENLETASGRGLLLIRNFMDEVTHNATGNEITMTKRKVPRNC